MEGQTADRFVPTLVQNKRKPLGLSIFQASGNMMQGTAKGGEEIEYGKNKDTRYDQSALGDVLVERTLGP